MLGDQLAFATLANVAAARNWWVWGAIAALVILAVVLSYVAGLNRRLRKLSARLEAQLAEGKRIEEALAASEAFYHSLVEHLPLNIIRKDIEGRFTFGN